MNIHGVLSTCSACIIFETVIHIHCQIYIFSFSNKQGGCNGHVSGRHCNAGLHLLFFGTWLDIELAYITILHVCVITFSFTDFVSATYTLFLGAKCTNMLRFAEDIALQFMK